MRKFSRRLPSGSGAPCDPSGKAARLRGDQTMLAAMKLMVWASENRPTMAMVRTWKAVLAMSLAAMVSILVWAFMRNTSLGFNTGE